MTLKIYYDGDCYFCRNYVELVKLRNLVGDVELISVRENAPDVDEVIGAGYNLNTGFVVEHDGQVFYGADAYGYLNKITRKDTLFTRAIGLTSGISGIAKVIYPVLVFLRLMVLALQGLALIDVSKTRQRSKYEGSVGVRILRLTPLILCLAYFGGVVAGYSIFANKVGDAHQLAFTGFAVCSFGLFLFFFARPTIAPWLYGNLRDAGWTVLLTWFCVWLAVVNSGELIIERRFLGLLAALPLIGIFIDLFLEGREGSSEERKFGLTPRIYPVFLIVFVLFPGVYIAPFYGGIVGWYDDIDKNRLIEISGIKLVNDKGQEIWHNPVFLQPNTLIGRFRHAYTNSGTGNDEDYIHFLYENYERIYPGLERGHLPHQWALGDFAYPPHSLTHNNASAYVPNFSPVRISKIQILSEYYDWDGNFVKNWVRTEVLFDGVSTEINK